MSDIDPAKLTEADRLALFASFTKDLTPPTPARRPLADQVAPWIPAVVADRHRGLDWKQLSAVFNDQLKIKISALSLQRIVTAAIRASTKRPKAKRHAQKPSAGTPSV